MTSAHDQLEAQAFRRRRLVRAVFSADAELEGCPPAPFRALAAGCLLAVLSAVAAGLTGVIHPGGEVTGHHGGGRTAAVRG